MKITNRGRQTVNIELSAMDAELFAKMAAQASGFANDYDVTYDDELQFERLACFFGFMADVLQAEGDLNILTGHHRKFLPAHLREGESAA